jgi:hypothetical protein
MHRDRRRGRADIDRNAVVLDQQADLLAQVVAEKVGPRDRGHVGPGLRHVTEGKPRVDLAVGRRGDADLGVEGAVARGRHPAILHHARNFSRRKPVAVS